MHFISCYQKILQTQQFKSTLTKGPFFWDYSGIGILGINGICVLLGAIPFRMNRMEGMWFARNRQNTRSFGKFLAGNPTRPTAPVADIVVLR